MSMKSKFEKELIIEKTIIYPAYLNKENLIKFTFLILDAIELFRKENVEVQIRNCVDKKAVEWQLKTFYFDKGFCLDKTYTFYLMPDWSLQFILEHSGTENSACKKVILTEQENNMLQETTTSFLSHLTHYYQMTGREGMENRYLNTANWRAIYAKSMKEDQVKNSENRIQEYLKFITKPLGSFKS
ncbi:MAG TPA: hypothetical protein PLL00_05215 [Bacteroidia bacterium]|nr:hypothetical protein [Bacteroidia bacterium]